MRHRQSTGLLKEVLDELRNQGMMRCCRCKEIKGKDNFCDAHFYKVKYPYCKPCKRESQRQSERKTNLRNMFGMSTDDYQKLYDKQNGRCAICRNIENFPNFHTGEPISLAVDHCHKTNKIRGLLCRNCNLMLGNSKDNVGIHYNAIKYLLENQ